MAFAGKMIVAGFCGLALALSAHPATAQQTDPAWLVPLEKQMMDEWSCDVNYFLNMNQFQLGNNTVYEAKVQCVDGRQFDATRTGDTAPFDIRACQPVVC